ARAWSYRSQTHRQGPGFLPAAGTRKRPPPPAPARPLASATAVCPRAKPRCLGPQAPAQLCLARPRSCALPLPLVSEPAADETSGRLADEPWGASAAWRLGVAAARAKAAARWRRQGRGNKTLDADERPGAVGMAGKQRLRVGMLRSR